MTGLTPEESRKFLADGIKQLRRNEKFLLKHGWKKKEGEKTIWIRPGGEEYSNDMGLFGGHTLAIDKCKHDIVLKEFIQFEIQVFNDDEYPRNKKGQEEPIDWIFPCIKDSKLYHYSEAVSLAINNVEFIFDTQRWIKVKELILQNFDLDKIKSNQIIEIYEFWNRETDDWGFKL